MRYSSLRAPIQLEGKDNGFSISCNERKYTMNFFLQIPVLFGLNITNSKKAARIVSQLNRSDSNAYK